jgi:hypothetical protein
MGRNPAAPVLGETAGDGRDGNELGPSSGEDQHDGVSPWNGPQPTGPPEDWLRRVREGAPGLLRPADERAVSGVNPLRRAIENGEPQQGIISERSFSEQSSRHSRAAAAQEANERTKTGTQQPLAIDASRPTSWFQSLPKRLRPSPFAMKEEKARLRPPTDFSTREASRRALAVVAPAPATQQLNGETLLLHREPRSAAIESEKPAASTISQWVERLRRSIRTALPAAAANVSAANAHAEHAVATKNEEPFPTTLGTPQPVPARVLKRPTAERPMVKLDDGSLRQPATSVRFNPTSDWLGQGHGASRTQRHGNLVSELPTNPSLWPSVSARVERLWNHSSESEGARDSQRKSRNEEALAAQPVHRLPVDSVNGSVKWLESAPSDLWPELPTDTPRATPSQTLFLRNVERLRALDIEQRGGR